MKPNRYYKWLLNSKKTQKELKNWVVDNDGDVFDGKSLSFGEVLKFRMGNEICTLWVTGYSSVEFVRAMRKFKRSER